jgi:hypothetical protein
MVPLAQVTMSYPRKWPAPLAGNNEGQREDELDVRGVVKLIHKQQIDAQALSLRPE